MPKAKSRSCCIPLCDLDIQGSEGHLCFMGRCMVTEVQLAAYGGGECLRQTEFSFRSRIVDEEGPEDSRLWAHWNLG